MLTEYNIDCPESEKNQFAFSNKNKKKGKHGGTLVCHLLQDLKVSGSNINKTRNFLE